MEFILKQAESSIYKHYVKIEATVFKRAKKELKTWTNNNKSRNFCISSIHIILISLVLSLCVWNMWQQFGIKSFLEIITFVFEVFFFAIVDSRYNPKIKNWGGF